MIHQSEPLVKPFLEFQKIFLNKLKLSCAKLKFSLVRVVTEDDIEVIVAVQYLSVGWVGGWWTKRNQCKTSSN